MLDTLAWPNGLNCFDEEGDLVQSNFRESGSRENEIRQIGVALHDLCQPLTTLQCRLEMAQLLGTPEAYREAVDAAMTECGRLADAVSSMRETVRLVASRSASEEHN